MSWSDFSYKERDALTCTHACRANVNPLLPQALSRRDPPSRRAAAPVAARRRGFRAVGRGRWRLTDRTGNIRVSVADLLLVEPALGGVQ